MAYQIRYSFEARRDLRKVFEDVWAISADLETARKYTADLILQISSIQEYPRIGFSLCIGDYFTGFYSVNFKAYKAFYRIDEPFIEVIRILPIKADHLRILFPQDE